MTMNKFITFVPRHQASAVCGGGKEQKTGGEIYITTACGRWLQALRTQ